MLDVGGEDSVNGRGDAVSGVGRCGTIAGGGVPLERQFSLPPGPGTHRVRPPLPQVQPNVRLCTARQGSVPLAQQLHIVGRFIAPLARVDGRGVCRGREASRTGVQGVLPRRLSCRSGRPQIPHRPTRLHCRTSNIEHTACCGPRTRVRVARRERPGLPHAFSLV